MAAIELMQSSPVFSMPNVGAAVVRTGNQATKAPNSTEQNTVQQEAQSSEKQVSRKDVEKAVIQLNAEMASTNESITFGYEAKLGQLFVQVTDNKSGEVIREIPSKEFIAHRIAMREMIGLLLDKQA